MRRKVLLAFAAALMITGCVHHSPFLSEYYFQAMGDDGELVMTLDAEALKNSSVSIPSNEILDRSERISVAMTPSQESSIYPLPLSSWTLYGAAEGNFGTLLVPAVISHLDGFERGEGKTRYYTNGSISVGVPETGLLLFSTGDYLEAKDKTLDNRSILIPHSLAKEMASPLMSIYVSEPRTMLDLGFEIPYAVITGMEFALITITEKDGSFFLSATVSFCEERDAQTFMTLIRNMVVQQIRREGGKLDFKLLSEMIAKDGKRTLIRNMEMSKEDVRGYMERALALSGGMI